MRSRCMRRERARDHRATWLAIGVGVAALTVLAIGVIVGLVAAMIT